ncbi:hypothetical protein RLOC_00013789 [Lonchura striata]|uniref:Uncharacterized protein n=1 Tax=Lonchura striata TaxID=40157 RepID=A0A218UPT2_9PASE|nr:hypothetical protein RLOC_00013789 [Lonchura striata domestica]
MASLPQLWGSTYLNWNGLVALIHERLILPSSEVKHRFSLHSGLEEIKETGCHCRKIRLTEQEDESSLNIFCKASFSFLSSHHVFTGPLLVNL